jgi:hypothetical protein
MNNKRKMRKKKKFPAIAGVTGIHHHAQLLVEMGSCEHFSWAGLKL